MPNGEVMGGWEGCLNRPCLGAGPNMRQEVLTAHASYALVGATPLT